MPLFFTGKSVSSHTLVASPARTFQDFFRQYINLPVPLSVTHDEYWAMDDKSRKKAKLVGYVVAATFPRSPWEGRKLEHAQPANLLILDIDNSDDARPFVEDPGSLLQLLKDFNFVVYRTLSSTPQNPRLRIMVEAHNIPVDRYPDAVLTVGKLLGLTQVTRESIIATQPQFRPTTFSDQDPELEHPVLITRFDARAFKKEDISGETETLPGIVSGGKPARVASNSSSVDDFLLFYQSPVAGLTLEQIKEALEFVEPDCSRPEWINIAAALKHQFGATQDDEAYELFDTWSATGSKYDSDKDTATVWKSYSEQAKGRRPITIHSLLKRAVEGGWNCDQVKENTFEALSKWIMFTASTSLQLINEGVRRIAAAPLLTATEEGALLQTLVQRSRQDFQQPLPIIAVRRDLKKLKEALIMKKHEASEVIHPPWSLGFVYVAATDTFLRHRTRQEYKRIALDSVFSRKLLPTAEELQAMDKDVNEHTLGTPKFLPSLYLLNHLKCQTVDDVTYNPAAPEDIIVREDGKLYVNIYRRSYREADPALASYVEDLMCEQLSNLIAEPHYRTHLLDWMAYNVQYPGSKLRHALLLQGGEGCGKTLIFYSLRAALGNDNTKIVNSDTIKKGWNEWAFGSQVVCIEELRVAGVNRHEVMNTLKEPITNDFVPVNERAKNTRNVQNRTNYLAFTNHHDAIVVGEDSRRWWVVKSALQHKEQIRAIVDKDPEYFARFAESHATHAGGYRHFFENHTISSNFKPSGPAPATTYLQEMVSDTSDELTAAITEAWEEGNSPLIGNDVVAFTTLRSALDINGLKGLTQARLAHALRNAGFQTFGKHMIGTVRQSVWARPDRLNGENPVELLLQRSENSSML